MNFPILSAIIFIPLIGALFILITRGPQKNVEKNSKYVAIFSSLTNLLLSLFLWYSFDASTSDFQFVEEKNWAAPLEKRRHKYNRPLWSRWSRKIS